MEDQYTSIQWRADKFSLWWSEEHCDQPITDDLRKQPAEVKISMIWNEYSYLVGSIFLIFTLTRLSADVEKCTHCKVNEGFLFFFYLLSHTR